MSKNKKNITVFHLKIIIFIAVKNCSILRRHVFVMIMPMGTAKWMISLYIQSVFPCLDSRRSLVCISEISSLQLVSLAAQPG